MDYGLSKKWSFLCRTTPGVAPQMKLLEHHIKETLIPSLIGRDYISNETRRIFSLPARLGGLGFLDPMSMSDIEYECSLAATTQLTNAIFTQQRTLDIDRVALSETLKSVTDKKNSIHKQSLTQIKEESSGKLLGLTWSCDLDWKDNMKQLCDRFSEKSRGVMKVMHWLSFKRRKELVESSLISILRYGLELVSGGSENLIDKLGRLQSKCARIILQKGRRNWSRTEE